MWKADKFSSLPDIVKEALEEMASFVERLSTITLPPEIKNRLKKVKEKLERVQKAYPQLRCDFEEAVYEQFKVGIDERQSPSDDNQIDIYEPVLEEQQMKTLTPTQFQIKRDKPIMRSDFEQQTDKTSLRTMRDTPPPVPGKKTLRPVSPLRRRQQSSPGSSHSIDRKSSQSSVGDSPVSTYEDPAAIAPMLYSSRTKEPGLNRRDTLFPQDSWHSPLEDRSEVSLPIPPPLLRPSGIYCAKSDQHKDPPTKRSSIRIPPKTSKTKGGNESSSYCLALWDCDADVDNELSFRRGDRMKIIDRQYEGKGWIVVELRGETGLVPFNYVDILTDSTHM